MKPKPLAIDLLKTDGGTQSRTATIHDVVEDYAAIIAASHRWPFPPVDVFHDGVTYFVGDGFHRVFAGHKAKRGSIPCIVHKGTAEDARIFAMTANDKHGLRMTREDKRKCVEYLLDDDTKRTQAQIAELAGVDVRTVKRIVADRKFDSIDWSSKAGDGETQKGTLSPSPPSRGGSADQDNGADETPRKTGKPPKKFPRSHWLKQYDQSIGPVVRLIDKIASEVGESGGEDHKYIQDHLQHVTESMEEWLK